MKDLLGESLSELKADLATLGEPKYRATQVWEWLYRKGARSIGEMTNLSASLRQELQRTFFIGRLEVRARKVSGDGTVKWLMGLRDGEAIETVLIPEENRRVPRNAPPRRGGQGTPPMAGPLASRSRRTLCVSTQAGCAFGCVFCSTALMKLRRSLTVSEIIGQVLTTCHESGGRRQGVGIRGQGSGGRGQGSGIRGQGGEGRDEENRLDLTRLNLVFMGMGEPTDNLDAVLRAAEILMSAEGAGMSPRRITVSTVGVIPGLERLARTSLNVAVSLNAVRDDLRTRLMPVNKKYPLADLLAACRKFKANARGRLTFEYVLLAGINDLEEDARLLAEMSGQVGARVNVIPYNPGPGLPFSRPADSEVDRFCRILVRYRGRPLVRKSRGADIQAACGQLAVWDRRPAVPGSCLPAAFPPSWRSSTVERRTGDVEGAGRQAPGESGTLDG